MYSELQAVSLNKQEMKTDCSHYPTYSHRARNKFKTKGKGRPVTCQAGTWEGSGIALPIFVAGDGQRHAPTALPPKNTPVTLFRGGSLGFWADLDGSAKSRPPPPGFDPRTFQPVA